jgi:hypothetical protein
VFLSNLTLFLRRVDNLPMRFCYNPPISGDLTGGVLSLPKCLRRYLTEIRFFPHKHEAGRDADKTCQVLN